MPPRKNNNGNNVIDERNEELIKEVDDILSSLDDNQIPPQPEHHGDNGDELLIDIEQQKTEENERPKEVNKEEDFQLLNENNVAQQNEEEIQLGEDEEAVDLDLDEWEKKTDKQVKRQIKRAENDLKLREEANSTMFMDKLNTFNSMFKTKIDANKFIGNVTEAWELMNSEDEPKQFQGKNMLHDTFKDAIKEAFEIEKASLMASLNVS